jgi:hypothetical protein
MRNPVKMPDNVEVSKLTPRRRPGKLAMSIRSPGHMARPIFAPQRLSFAAPARRGVTVRDRLTSCMGFGSVMAMPDTYPIQKLIREYRIGGDGPKLPSQMPATAE